MLVIWSLVPLPFLNQAWTSGSSQFTYYWSLTCRILSITLLTCQMSTTVWWFEHSLALPFFGIGMKTDLFQSCGHCWVFQICWHIESSIFTASSFRIWNSSTGIPSPPGKVIWDQIQALPFTSCRAWSRLFLLSLSQGSSYVNGDNNSPYFIELQGWLNELMDTNHENSDWNLMSHWADVVIMGEIMWVRWA